MSKTINCNLNCPACHTNITKMKEHHLNEDLAVFRCFYCGYTQTISNNGEFEPQEELNIYYNEYIKKEIMK